MFVKIAFILSLFIAYAVKAEKNLDKYPLWTVIPNFFAILYILTIIDSMSFYINFIEDISTNELIVKSALSIVLITLNSIFVYLIFGFNKKTP